jgi:hypothetical protein
VVRTLVPGLKDFNDDLRQFGPAALAASVRMQLAPADVIRFWRYPEPDKWGQVSGGRHAD